MDFFARQDLARRKTGLLVTYFVLAVVLIILAVNAVVYFFIAYFSDAQISSMPMDLSIDHTVWLYISLFTLLVIVGGSLLRLIALARGGAAVASMVDARQLDLSTGDANERRYINVVEEMSIASGVPMPRLYVMDKEPGINAFVAGYRPTEAIMVVTRGALDELSRDELQGVVGHEFSHILNGDMRLNIRLMAILAGILLIGKIGEILMRSSGRSSRGKNQAALLGLALFAVGYIGLFFGRLIKAAISRQREFLADASSVQFTRNPPGIAGALYKIRQAEYGTLLNNNYAEDMSHMCFGETMRFRLKNLLATHPSLDERINAVSPNFLAIRKFDALQPAPATPPVVEGATGFVGAMGYHTSAEQLAESVGNPSAEHLNYAETLHDRFSQDMLNLLHQPQGALALVYTLVIEKMDRQTGLAFLQQHADNNLVERVRSQLAAVHDMDRNLRLPLIDLAIPALKQLPDENIDRFLDLLEQLIKLDKKVSLLEFVLLTILQQRLSANASRINRIRYRSFRAVRSDIQLLLSALAQCSGNNHDKVTTAFDSHMRTFTVGTPPLIAISDITTNDISTALHRLNLMPAMMKKSFLTVCADLVIQDGIIMPNEAELLRAIAESLDCPMPPLV